MKWGQSLFSRFLTGMVLRSGCRSLGPEFRVVSVLSGLKDETFRGGRTLGYGGGYRRTVLFTVVRGCRRAVLVKNSGAGLSGPGSKGDYY